MNLPDQREDHHDGFQGEANRPDPAQFRIILHEMSITKVLQGESDGSQLLDQQADDVEARNDFWSISGNHIYRHHVEPRVKLCESFPLPLQYVDVVRRTITTLDVLRESRIDDSWNVDGDRELSGHNLEPM